MEFKHEPIMLNECIENLKIKEDGVYVDGTLGGAGHSSEIVKRLSNEGVLIGIDRDTEALKASGKRLEAYTNVQYVHGQHEDIKVHVQNLGYEKVDGILLDLGISSYQIDEGARGFSYTKDAVLDMRMDQTTGISAKEIVNTYKKEDLEKIFREYGEEKFSKKIADRIVNARSEKEIVTTYELADILNDGGRLCIITFHSLEDRIVKEAFIELQGKCTCPKDFPKCICGFKSYGKIVTRKPIVPSEDEEERNPRSKSAKLRVFERVI